MSWRAEPQCLDSYNTYSDLSYELISQDLYLRFLIILYITSELQVGFYNVIIYYNGLSLLWKFPQRHHRGVPMTSSVGKTL